MRINTHILSLMSQRTLLSTTKALARAMQRLASGQRINSARDDAAGMALGTGLESQRRGMLQAVRNMNDSRGFLSTAEGALSAQTELIQRMRELALQSANGTLSDTERGYLNTELQQLVSEFDRVAKQTEFNGVKLLDGSFATTSLQVGTSKGEDISFSIEGTTIENVFLGIEHAAFQNRSTIGVGIAPYFITSGDFNEDGYQDLAEVNFNTGTVSVLRNLGDGTFASPTSLSLSGTDNPNSIVAVDVNNDGHLDLATMSQNGGGYLSVFLGNGNGTFQSRVTTAGGQGYWLTSGDFNGDGNADFVYSQITISEFGILIGNGNGSFQTRVTYTTGSNPKQMKALDLNGDGIQDILLAEQNTRTVSAYYGNGNGTFQARQVVASSGSGLSTVATEDINNDGILDIITSDITDRTISLSLGNGNGTFQTRTTLLTSAYPDFLVTSDFDNDGNIDLVTANHDSQNLSVYYGNGNGTFESAQILSTGSTPNSVVAVDLNGDSKPDLASVDQSSATVSVFLQDTTGDNTALYVAISLSVRTQHSAQNALEVIDYAFNRINSARSSIGAIQSRLDYAENNALNLIENISAARSQLMDADFAEETAEFTRLQILQQAGLAVMGQANLNLRLVLELLR